MAQNHGLADDEGADATVLVVVHVAAADADGANAHAHVVRADRLGQRKLAEG
jgi:hypothetical protein